MNLLLFSVMPRGRPFKDLESVKEEIISSFQAGRTILDIAGRLRRHHDITVTDRTVKSRFQSWGISKRVRTDKNEQLFDRIRTLYFTMALNDSDMLQVLHNEGFQISLLGLRRVRKELNLFRAHISTERKQLLEDTMQNVLQQEIQKGVIQGCGRRLVYNHFRRQGYNFPRFVRLSFMVLRLTGQDLFLCLILTSHRDKLFTIYRTLLPDVVDRRKRDLQGRRGEYTVPGPNFIWSVDGYNKLRSYGIEIYAALDAYARYVVWIYVGISNRTQVSVLSQYLSTIQAFGQQPRFIRSDPDRRDETSLLASAHHQLQQEYEPGLEFQDCYLYGTSTANQRIEAWWGQITHSQLFKWRVRLNE